MNYDAFNYRIQMHLTEQEVAQFRALYTEMQSEVLEIFLEAEQHDGFQDANDVIDRIRGM
jgi:hypothetical protein